MLEAILKQAETSQVITPIVCQLTGDAETINTLAQLLVETVAGNGSVGFMHPLPFEEAHRFWTRMFELVAKGDKIVLGAHHNEQLIGTVSLALDCPDNQPHRAEIAKMMTAPAFRGRGVASRLMFEAEALAVKHRRSLLVLDTAETDGAAPFYERLGYQRAGVIPDYAFKPLGGLTGTILFWKSLQLSDDKG